MSETTDLARTIVQAIADAVAALPVRMLIGQVADVRVDSFTELISGFSVNLPAGRTECEWLGAVDAELKVHPTDTLVGRDCRVDIIDGRAIVQGVIWTGVVADGLEG